MSQVITTVEGDVSPSDLGRTLTHEHMSMQFDVAYVAPIDSHLSQLEWTLYNSSWIRHNPYSHADNIVLNDAAAERAVMDSVLQFKHSGGGCLVENSTFGLQRKTGYLRTLSQKTGVHVVAGTGYYVNGAQSKDTLNLSEEKMAAFMCGELGQGCHDDSSIRCGLVGEIGCSYPLYDFERRLIRSCAAVQNSQQCAVSFHPGRNPEAPFEIMRIFQEAGGKAAKVIMSHLERTLQRPDELVRFAGLGCYCQFDLFGIENSYYQLAGSIDFPSDAQRMDYIVRLVNEGYEDKILVAHDIHTKHRLETYGGHGYSHILKNAVPKLLNVKGLTQSQVDKILIQNPAKVLSKPASV